jgi:glycosyltransferase involved in cell wall biosynthesis
LWLEKPAIVQSWMYHADLAATLALYWSGRRQSTRLIWGLRCSDMDTSHYGVRLRAVIWACALLSGRPNAIVSNSTAGRDFHISMGYPPSQFVIIPNGIDVDRFRPSPAARHRFRAELGLASDERVVAHVARVDPMKDHRCFFDSLDLLPQTRALLIGQGTEHLPPHPRILRLGRRDDVPALLNAADVIVSSSAFGEGFSNAIAEGMASGLPAVATDTGDARQLVGETGVVVPPRDPRALAAGIASIFSAGGDAVRVRGLMARRRVEDLFSLHHAVGAFRKLYAET